MIGEYGLEILNFGNTWYRSHKDGTVLKSAVDHKYLLHSVRMQERGI